MHSLINQSLRQIEELQREMRSQSTSRDHSNERSFTAKRKETKMQMFETMAVQTFRSPPPPVTNTGKQLNLHSMMERHAQLAAEMLERRSPEAQSQLGPASLPRLGKERNMQTNNFSGIFEVGRNYHSLRSYGRHGASSALNQKSSGQYLEPTTQVTSKKQPWRAGSRVEVTAGRALFRESSSI